jgi:hypothetical protein
MNEQSHSRYIESNGGEELCRDEKRNPLNGEIFTQDGFIHRFFGGLLDGDTKTGAGTVSALPAVEGPGHLEWWRSGRLHRDNGLPAVVSDNFQHQEWWEQGKYIKSGELRNG